MSASESAERRSRFVRVPAVILLACACMAMPMRAAVLPTDLEAKVGADYQPQDDDERAIWQSLSGVEAAIRGSPQRLIAPEVEAYTRRVIERLIGRPAPELRIYLMRDATFNAAMYPSGMMIVNTGLLARVRDEAQFAAVLGHEAGHYFRKHSVDRYRAVRQKSAMIEVTSAAGRGNGYGWAPGNDSWNAITEVTAMSIYKFSRDQESEADAYGVMLMARAGYPPRAAPAICGQLLDERRASAAARGKRYFDRAGSSLSTHPPTERRATDLADTAERLAGKAEPPASENAGGESPGDWNRIVGPLQAMLLHEQVFMNDPGATLYLLEGSARNGWTALLRFNEGEVYRLRHADGDDSKAAAAYAAAIALPDAPPDAWRGHGYALLKMGRDAEAREAFSRYLAMDNDAADRAMIRSNLAGRSDYSPGGADEASRRLTVKPGPHWKKLPAGMDETRWEDLWTRNGPQRDRLALIGGLPEGKTYVAQPKNADQQVPVFRADMTAQDLASMIEISYRLKGVSLFAFESVTPVEFLGGSGVELRYDYASGVGFTKKGRCVMRIVGRKLYVMKMDGVASADFDLAIAEFEQMAASARLGE